MVQAPAPRVYGVLLVPVQVRQHRLTVRTTKEGHEEQRQNDAGGEDDSPAEAHSSHPPTGSAGRTATSMTPVTSVESPAEVHHHSAGASRKL
jgi:hypothetical protein